MLIKSQLGFPKRISGFLFAKNQKKASVVGVGRNWNPCAPLVRVYNGAATVENNIIVSNKIKHGVTVKSEKH